MELQLKSVAEYLQGLRRKAALTCRLPPNRTHLGHGILQALKESPNSVQIDASDGRSECYSSVLNRALQLARTLFFYGYQPGDPAVILTTNDLDACLPFYACLFNGHPLATINYDCDIHNINYYLSLIRPKMIFCQEEKQELFKTALIECDLSIKIIIIGHSEKSQLNTDLAEYFPLEFDLSIPAFLVMTNGTTAQPRLAWTYALSLTTRSGTPERGKERQKARAPINLIVYSIARDCARSCGACSRRVRLKAILRSLPSDSGRRGEQSLRSNGKSKKRSSAPRERIAYSRIPIQSASSPTRKGYIPVLPLKKLDNSVALDDVKIAECFADSIESQCSHASPPHHIARTNRIEEKDLIRGTRRHLGAPQDRRPGAGRPFRPTVSPPLLPRKRNRPEKVSCDIPMPRCMSRAVGTYMCHPAAFDEAIIVVQYIA
ncbi:hypothetical protein EVAR_49792_1 [Eumeta japonica]|uniref:AMP-dependent synthetase/ligase domain-containing protein n=1 Tax=Eumeta variegata TaxID=151549 RepID=A0A4C1YV97_EUMVA|nr:hypothetical protein EVAR_49792_1 [Eumeta japonica]